MTLPLTVIGGYLGAGKTTLINRVLAGDHGLRLMVMVNDFGAINIDAELLASATEDRMELTNGCVCCTMGADLFLAIGDVLRGLDADHSDHSNAARKALAKGCPLAIACAYEVVGRVRGARDIRRALEMEYRFTHRAVAESDFLEGIRALVIDRDRTPNWTHMSPEDVTQREVVHMLMPLGADRLSFERRRT